LESKKKAMKYIFHTIQNLNVLFKVSSTLRLLESFYRTQRQTSKRTVKEVNLTEDISTKKSKDFAKEFFSGHQLTMMTSNIANNDNSHEELPILLQDIEKNLTDQEKMSLANFS
jgi:hypothetical protein